MKSQSDRSEEDARALSSCDAVPRERMMDGGAGLSCDRCKSEREAGWSRSRLGMMSELKEVASSFRPRSVQYPAAPTLLLSVRRRREGKNNVIEEQKNRPAT